MPMTEPVLPAAIEAAHQTQAMMDRIAHLQCVSTAEALRALRSAFPELPLAARVTALEALRRTGSGLIR